MKTLKDLFELINLQTELNIGKVVKFTFEINTRYNWVSMYRETDLTSETKIETILSNESIQRDCDIQLVYWTIFNKSRFE